MIKISYDGDTNTVVIELEGGIDAVQAEKCFSELDKVLPKHGKGFRLLTDFSSVESMEPAVKPVIEEAMEVFDAMWVNEILRVLPDPAMDIGFNILALTHYSKHPKIITCRTRAEAEEYLRKV